MVTLDISEVRVIVVLGVMLTAAVAVIGNSWAPLLSSSFRGAVVESIGSLLLPHTTVYRPITMRIAPTTLKLNKPKYNN